MKRRVFGSATMLALILVAVLATSGLAASPYRFHVRRDACQTSGGAYGFGYVKFGVRVKEIGKSGATYFRIRSKVQYRDANGHGWYTLKDWGWEYSNTFPNNADSYYHDLTRRYDPTGTPDASAHRIWMKVQVWGNSGRLASRVMTGQKCVTGL